MRRPYGVYAVVSRLTAVLQTAQPTLTPFDSPGMEMSNRDFAWQYIT